MMSSNQTPTLWDKIWKDKHGKIVIWQTPNVPLMLWIALTIVSFFVKHGTVHDILHLASSGVLVVWATIELFNGINYFRRALGLIVLIFTIANIAGV